MLVTLLLLLHDYKVSVPGDVSTALRSAQHDTAKGGFHMFVCNVC